MSSDMDPRDELPMLTKIRAYCVVLNQEEEKTGLYYEAEPFDKDGEEKITVRVFGKSKKGIVYRDKVFGSDYERTLSGPLAFDSFRVWTRSASDAVLREIGYE